MDKLLQERDRRRSMLCVTVINNAGCSTLLSLRDFGTYVLVFMNVCVVLTVAMVWF
jgi:hypothetical protein